MIEVLTGYKLKRTESFTSVCLHFPLWKAQGLQKHEDYNTIFVKQIWWIILFFTEVLENPNIGIDPLGVYPTPHS